MTDKIDKELGREFDREMLKSAVISIFAAVVAFKKTRGKYSYAKLAADLGRNKSAVSRWFSDDPNFELNTVSDIANALDIELRIEAIDRATQTVFNPHRVGSHPVIEIDFGDTSGSRRPNTPVTGRSDIKVVNA